MDGRDYLWGAGKQPLVYASAPGPIRDKSDVLRYWVDTLYTIDPRVLELPPVYLDSRVEKGLTTRDVSRRDAQWDDHGEAYARDSDGPNLQCTVRIPEGTFCLSFYELNSNGHSGNNRFRDYRISVRDHTGFPFPRDIRGIEKKAEFARSRVTAFWGGVYKRFAVKGPTEVMVQIYRNHSLNTTLAAVMLDEMTDIPESHFPPRDVEKLAARPPPRSEPDLDTIAKLLDGYLARCRNDIFASSESGPVTVLAARWVNESARLNLATSDQRFRLFASQLHYHLWQFAAMESTQQEIGLAPARNIERSLDWNQQIPNNSGLGRQAVMKYLSLHADRNSSARMESN
jgi:hypothetical protein